MEIGVSNSQSLAILVPAYNQGDGAIASITHISQNLQLMGLNIEVLISDNCSLSSSYLDEFQPYEKAGWLRVFRQERNIGFAENVRFLASQSNSSYSLVLGCGDIPQLMVINQVLSSIAQISEQPSVIIGGVSSHSNDSALRVVPNAASAGETYDKWRSTWAPYQEAIPGQIYLTQSLIQHWPNSPRSGNLWPHVELAVGLVRGRNVRVVRYTDQFVSMHQDGTGWYLRPGANIRTILRHIEILIPALLGAGIGVVIKLVTLAVFGIPSAFRQDIIALAQQNTSSRSS